MSQLLPYLLFLACPISMGVMMWVMMRPHESQPATPPADPRVTELQRQVDELKAALHAPEAKEPETERTGV